MPEPMLAIVNVGKRDISYDIELPVAEAWFRPDDHTSPRSLGHGITTTQINDQHIFLSIPADCGMRIGDLVGFGVSHPCTTFDKWRLIYVTNRHHDVVDAVVTFF